MDYRAIGARRMKNMQACVLMCVKERERERDVTIFAF